MKEKDPNKSQPQKDNSSDQNSAPEAGVSSAPTSEPANSDSDKVSLVDELGIDDIDEPVFGGHGRLFSAAGRHSPIAEFTDEFLILHPPQQPFEDEDAESEVIVIRMDDQGILINELGNRKKVPGARFQGRDIYYYWEQKPGTMKHYGVFFDDSGSHHFLIIDGERLTTSVIFQLRNMTHDGELSKFTELTVE